MNCCIFTLFRLNQVKRMVVQVKVL